MSKKYAGSNREKLDKVLIFILAGALALVSHGNKTRLELEQFEKMEEASVKRREKTSKNPVDGEYKEVE